MVDSEVRYATVHNRRVKVVMQQAPRTKQQLKLPQLTPPGKQRHQQRSQSVCSGERLDETPGGQAPKVGRKYRQEAKRMTRAIGEVSGSLKAALKEFRDHVTMWSRSIEAGLEGCGPLEIIEAERQRIQTKLNQLDEVLTTSKIEFGDKECASCARAAELAEHNTQDPTGSAFLTDLSSFDGMSDGIESRDREDVTLAEFRSLPTHFQVQLNHALSGADASDSMKLDSCLSVLRDISQHLGPFKGITVQICDHIRSLTFDPSYGHDPLSGCVLEKAANLKALVTEKDNRLKQLSSNLERLTLAPSRVLEAQFDKDTLESIARESKEQLAGLDTPEGVSQYAAGDKPLVPAVTAALAVAKGQKPNRYLDPVAFCAYELAELATSHEALQRIRETATPLHMLSSMRLSLLAQEHKPKDIEYIIDQLNHDIKSTVNPSDIQAARPALRQVLTHFCDLISRDDFGSLAISEDPKSGDTLYSITDRFDYSSIELISSIDSIFNQALAEIADVSAKREVAFLTAKAQADNRTIEKLEKQLHSAELHVDDLQQKTRGADSMIRQLKRDLKQAAKGVFRERIDMHTYKALAEEEQHKRKEDSEKHTADQTRRRELARRGKWKEMQVKLQDEELQTSFDMASDYIQTLEHECHVKTPRYLTDDTDPTISRLKDLLQVEGVFLRGKKHSRESLIFVLDQLLDKAKDLKKTKDLLEIIKENSGMGDPGGDNTAAQYHSGLGLGPAVPCFLRHRGKVKYSAIGKKEAESIVQEVWAEREELLETEGTEAEISFAEHFHAFLKKRYNTDTQATEMAYNLVHALEQFKWDADCNIFLKIAREELAEGTAAAQEDLMQDVVSCIRLVYFGHPEEEGYEMTQQEFITTLRRCLPMKSDADMSELESALVSTVGAGIEKFDPEIIFEETEDFSETAVVEGIRAQFVLDLENFILCIEDTARNMAETGPDGVTMISARKARDALKLVDGLKTMEQCMECVAEIFGIPADEIQEEDVALLDDFNRSLRTVLILPTLPPNSFLDKARSQKTALEYQAKVRKREGK